MAYKSKLRRRATVKDPNRLTWWSLLLFLFGLVFIGLIVAGYFGPFF